MSLDIDHYFSSLMAYAPGAKEDFLSSDRNYATLIHVPASGGERVYSLLDGDGQIRFSRSLYRRPLWDWVEEKCPSDRPRPKPSVDILQSELSADHPILFYLSEETLSMCASRSDGSPGQDYYLLMWRVGNGSGTVECWDPFGRVESAWTRAIAAFQVLASQFEFQSDAGSLATAS